MDDHMIFEVTQSPLYQSNDGRLVYNHSVGPIGTFVLFLDGAEIFATNDRVALDAYIAGYDAARSHHYVDDTPAPPEHLADAWARHQKGEEVSQADLRKLDEWRADAREDALGW